MMAEPRPEIAESFSCRRDNDMRENATFDPLTCHCPPQNHDLGDVGCTLSVPQAMYAHLRVPIHGCRTPAPLPVVKEGVVLACADAPDVPMALQFGANARQPAIPPTVHGQAALGVTGALGWILYGSPSPQSTPSSRRPKPLTPRTLNPAS